MAEKKTNHRQMRREKTSDEEETDGNRDNEPWTNEENRRKIATKSRGYRGRSGRKLQIN